MPVHTQVAAKDFLTILISLLKTRDTPEVQVKILYLIKKWGNRFEKQKDILPNFSEVYNTLKANSVIFPESYESTYYRYTQESYNNRDDNSNDFRNNNDFNYNSRQGNEFQNNNNFNDDQFQDQAFAYSTNVNLDLNPDNYDKKYKKFVTELTVLLDNINLANVFIYIYSNRK